MKQKSRWIWPALAVLSGVASCSIWSVWSVRSGPEADSVRQVTSELSAVLNRQRAYYRNNLAYTTSLGDLGLESDRSGDWQLRVVASRMDRDPLLLIEAQDGVRRLCIDRDGRLHRSTVGPLPSIPAWLPVSGGGYAGTR